MSVNLAGIKPTDIGFDFPEWRPNQLEVGERIVNSQKSIITLSAPTGFGKSVVNQIPARISLQRQLILTRTRILQTQYERDGLIALYGREHYACNRNMKVSAAQGICRTGLPCAYYQSGCNYFDAKRDAIASEEAVLNYSYFFLEANGPGQFTEYDYIVCDEGHSVPEELSRTFSIRIYFPDCRGYGIRVPKDKGLASLISWARSNLDRFRYSVNRSRPKEDRTDYVIRGMEFERKLILLSMIDEPANWIVETKDQSAIIRPIWPNFLAALNLWPHAKKFIFSSATINPYFTLPMLGIDPNQAEHIEVTSSFPKEYRPIFIQPIVHMSHRTPPSDLKKWVDEMDRIVDMYPDSKGLIHTANYQLAKTYTLNTRHVNRIEGHTQETRNLTLERFKARDDNKVLVSPAMTEGIDLPYDHCRFQVIAKVPYPNKLDKVWEARFAADPARASKVYTQTAIDQIVQAAGRGMRAEDDYCETWIIDANIQRLLQFHTTDFPRFFREALAKP